MVSVLYVLSRKRKFIVYLKIKIYNQYMFDIPLVLEDHCWNVRDNRDCRPVTHPQWTVVLAEGSDPVQGGPVDNARDHWVTFKPPSLNERNNPCRLPLYCFT